MARFREVSNTIMQRFSTQKHQHGVLSATSPARGKHLEQVSEPSQGQGGRQLTLETSTYLGNLLKPLHSLQ